MTAEELYNRITDKSVSRETGINLITNYGLRQQRDAITQLYKDLPFLRSDKIQKVINRTTAKLINLSEKTLEVCSKL